MEAGFIAILVMTTAIGIAVGILIGRKQIRRRYERDTQYTQGTLNVDCSDPEFEPNLFLSSAVPVKDIVSRKYVMLDVKLFSNDSRK